MAVASEYSGWVRELDRFQAAEDADDADDRFDPRHEASESALASNRQTSRSGLGTNRKAKARALSQTDELQQEMKLLNWHKLANEAALKAAIIKTNKIKREDSLLSRSMNHDDVEDKQLRIQQIIEEEQLRPLEVNSEFFRDFETKEQRDEAKLENDVGRHVQHLKRLKETMAQREDMQRRRQKYREGMQELHGGRSRSSSVTTNHMSNQEDEHLDHQGVKRHLRSNSMYNNRVGGSGHGGGSSQVICSLDKLMELEKRIRHLEDAGLGVDALEDDPRIERSAGGASEVDESGLAKTKAGGLHFSKRRSAGGSHEPSKTVFTVRPSASKANKVRAKEKPNPALKVGTSRQNKPQATFLTSLPESKQRQLRRMSERERRQFLKQEKASDEREKNLKQDVVIDGWLDKKRVAATNRKAVSSQVRNAQSGRGGSTSTRVTSVAAAGGRLGSKVVQPPPLPPKVRAPAVGAASGKRIANTHLQKFDDIKKGFERRNEALKRMPTNMKTGSSLLDTRGASSGAVKSSSAVRSRNTRIANSSERPAPRSSATLLFADRTSSSTAGSTAKGTLPTAPTKRPPNQSQKLPVITRSSGAPSGPYLGLSSVRLPDMKPGTSSNQAPAPPSCRVGSLPRIAPQPVRGPPAPSPPPQGSKNTSMPQFSRLHKR